MDTEGTASRPPTAKGLAHIGVQENEICNRDVALTFRSAGLALAENADLKVGATKQGPRTSKTGPRYACCSRSAYDTPAACSSN